MDSFNKYSELNKEKQSQILKLVTKSFYKELTGYGVNVADIVTVSVNLLDHVTGKKEKPENENGYYSSLFTLSDIQDYWSKAQQVKLNQITISPIIKEHVKQVCQWLKETEISQTFIRFFPKNEEELESYLFNTRHRQYFSVFSGDNKLVGLIGGEHIDEISKKLEMKKFIGDRDYQGKGIGKIATFLFLYYVFVIREFNKVYIHSLDTNIKNINLNSKFGFELEGILYSDVNVDSNFKDVLRMGLLKSDWNGIFGNSE